MGWFQKLFGRKAKDNAYVPEAVTSESMARRMVHSTKDNGWGNAIQFMEWEPDKNGMRKIYGHRHILEVGDWFAVELKSGKVGVLEVRGLEWKSDPPDMFFGEACDVGYVPDGEEIVFKPIKPRFVPLGAE